jgi:hypothetical protein
LPGTYEIRDDVIWPGDLLLPARPPKLVYLDMLGWINMAEVEAGNAAPAAYERLLEACRKARAEGRALFPLSSTTAIELYNVLDFERRKARVAVMDELSGFNYLLGRPQIQELEVEAAMNEIPGVTIAPQGPISLIGPSLLWSLGMRGGLVTNAPDPDAAAKQICEGLGIVTSACFSWLDRYSGSVGRVWVRPASWGSQAENSFQLDPSPTNSAADQASDAHRRDPARGHLSP